LRKGDVPLREDLVMLNCPQCNSGIDVDEEELDEGDSLICEDCGANLNVTGVSPLELSPGDDEDEDEDDDEDDDDFDDFDDDDEDEDGEDDEEE
jgi:alpha-aminoadipate carrier protein LysW